MFHEIIAGVNIYIIYTDLKCQQYILILFIIIRLWLKKFNSGVYLKFLTKSRFKLGYECPTKLCYIDNKEYGNSNHDNSFLKSLAEGGFQVGELAKIYHPGGTEITTQDKDIAANQTAELLTKEKVTIYEAAIKYENLFIKADVLVKNGNRIELIEVKAKSYSPDKENSFYNKKTLKDKNPKLNFEWESYLVDIAFQKYVFQKSYPQFEVNAYLMMTDKTVLATVDGINQKFFIDKDLDGHVHITIASNTTKETLGVPLLIKVPVDKEIELVCSMHFELERSFEEMVNFLSDICKSNKFVESNIGKKCKTCEFRIDNKMESSGLKSGFKKCWKQVKKFQESDFAKPFVFDIWNFRKADDLILEDKIFIEQIEEDDINPKFETNGLSTSDRQWIQIEKIKTLDKKPYFDLDGLQSEMKKWLFPLHFIDFETTTVAIPFNKGRRPYEQIAFQFSHHIVSRDGKITHVDEYINRDKGRFPNFNFVKKLRESLNKDEGTIFRYAPHENTVLCQIREQLLATEEVISDKNELIQFIESITKSSDKSANQWNGSRNMVDLCELVKKYYYHPLTNGSNSIKKVLPAILNESKYLQERFSHPIYGSEEIMSHNFKNWTWIKKENGNIVDPYKLLPPIFSDLDLETMDSLITEDSIADGGAAMTAYARMQFSEMSVEECDKVLAALLKYCELDTFAMVMIYEYWRHEIDQRNK